MPGPTAASPVKHAIKRAAAIAGILVALVLIGLAATVWLSSDDSGNLPLRYDGFDRGR